MPMKTSLIFCFLTLSACAYTFAQISADNYFPLGSYYLSDEQYYPIATVDGSKPIARVEGKNVEFDSINARFQRTEVYKEGFITIVEQSAYGLNSDVRSVRTNEDTSKIPNRGFVDLEIRPDVSLEDCYAIAFSGSDDGYSGRNKDEFYVNFKEIGDLSAGVLHKQTIPILFPNSIDADRDIRYFIAFFSSGMPVRSSFESTIANHFLLNKQAEHRFYLDQYLANNSSKSLNKTAFFTYTPYLPKKLYDSVGPVSVKAVFTIQSDGSVRTNQLTGIEDEAAKSFLENRINEWLFFPAIKDGTAVSSKTATMIEF